MLGNKQGYSSDHQPPKVFSGVCFLLLGFDPLNKANVLKKLVDGGAVDAGQLGPDCTHVIVHRLVYDDPSCVAARSNGKRLVTDLWVDHSFDVGMPLDPTSIMYRPLKDLNGIPSAKSLVICLTGYIRQDREDIMIMVGLMGANFSKPLVAQKVTHLICYKFEGEKYELAKKIKRIKLVNHHWLEDCLRAWEIISEANYTKSGYELETMEAEAKDSEEEADSIAVEQHTGRGASTQHPLMLKQEILGEPLDSIASKDFGSTKGMPIATGKSTSDQVSNLHEMQSKHPKVLGSCDTGEPSNPYNTAAICASENELLSASKSARSPSSDASKFSTISYSRKTPRRTTPPMHSEETGHLDSSMKRGKLNLGKSFEISSPTIPQENESTAAGGFKTPSKGSALVYEEKLNGTLSEKRKSKVLSGSSKLQKTGDNTKAQIPEHPVMASRTESVGPDFSENNPVDIINRPSPQSNETSALYLIGKSPTMLVMKSPSSGWKSVTRSPPISKTIASEIMQEGNMEAVQTYRKVLKAASNSKPKNGDVGISTPQHAIIGEQRRQNEAQEIEIPSPSSERLDIKKSNTNPESGGIGMSRPECAIDEDKELHNEMQDILIPSSNTKRSDTKKSPHSGNLELQKDQVAQSDSKPLGRKMVGRKTLGPKKSSGKGKTTNKKGSIYLKKIALENDSVTCSAGVKETADLEKFEMVPPAANSEEEMVIEKAEVFQSGKLTESRSACMNDETEPPEDKEEAVGEKCDKFEPDNTAGRVVEDEDKVKGGIGHKMAAHGKKRQLGKSTYAENQVKEKITKGKRRSLSTFKEKFVPSVSCVATEKSGPVCVDDETEPPEEKEEAVVDEKYDEAEADNTGSKVVEDESKVKGGIGHKSAACGKKSQLGEATYTVNQVKEKITKGRKCSLSKSKNNTVPSFSCETTKTGASKDESVSEDKSEKKEVEKGTISHAAGKTKRPLTLSESKNPLEMEKENMPIHIGDDNKSRSKKQVRKLACKGPKKSKCKVGESVLDSLRREHVPVTEPVWFILSGHRLQRKEFQQVIRCLKGRVCRDSHHWSYQATHFIVPDPIRRTEKFFAAAASGRWILKSEYLTASNQAGEFLSEEPYEWHKSGLSEDGAINLEAPRKWRLLKEKTGHGAFYGMRIIIYGECIAPPLDTLKRVVKAGDGTILATSPPYTRFLESGVDFAIVTPGMPRVDIWVQEFLRHEIPCVVADYLVEYVCKPGYSLERHVQYSTQAWAEKSLNSLKNRLEEIVEPSTPPGDNDVPCQVCGSRDRGDVMLICGDENGSMGCGVGTHIDCCDPPLEDVPEEDWFCTNCSKGSSSKIPQHRPKKKTSASKRK